MHFKQKHTVSLHCMDPEPALISDTSYLTFYPYKTALKFQWKDFYFCQDMIVRILMKALT